MTRPAERAGRPMTDSGGARGRRRVVIVGGGFGGLFAARALRRAPVEVTLVDRAYHHLFQPLLYQCATGILSEGQIAAPLRSVLKKHKNVKVALAEATGIDVGAGPPGVELAGQIRELATKTLRAEYRRAKPEEARVLLFDGGSAPLASFGPKLSAKVEKTLGKLGVEMHMGSIVTDIDMDGLAVRDHEGTITRYEVGTVLWTAGVEAPAFAKALADATGAAHGRGGRIVVQPDLTIPGHPEISVIGDLMSLDKLPGVAEVAMQGGLYAGHRIKREAEGRETGKPFRYHDLGSAAYISRGKAVMSAGPVQIGGLAGRGGRGFFFTP